MKKILLLSVLIITGCMNNTKPVENEEQEVYLDYSITEKDQIKWADVFLQSEERYMVYFYSETCGYCRILKEDILNYYLLNKEKIYFMDAIKENATFKSPASGMIGISCIDNFYIAGTPILVEFTKWTVTNLYAGIDDVKMYIDSWQ